MGDCQACGGAKHIRSKRGWIRCPRCAANVIDSMVIKPNIRCGEESYPEQFDKNPPWPLKDFTINGDYHVFRHMVWRSISHYTAIGDLSYEYLDAYRLVEIYLGKDSLYDRVRDLEPMDLVVVVLGVSDLPNKMLPPLVCQLLTLRRMNGKPTWAYVHRAGATLRSAYSNEMVDLLGPISSDVYGGVSCSQLPSTITREFIDT